MKMNALTHILTGALLAALYSGALAHHSNAEYDQSMLHEIEGEIVSARWRNPHIAFEVATIDENGAEVIWDLEALAVSALNRRGVTGEQLRVGERVRVAGFTSSHREQHMHAEHVLLPGDVELLTGFSREPHWTGTTIGTESGVLDPVEVAAAQGDGIFRVWSRDARTWYFHPPDQYPVTAAAAAQAAGWNDLEDNPVLRCEPPGMPPLMGNPYPMEFIDRGDIIEVRFEEFDAVREIHLAGGSLAAQPATHMGYSTGRWEDNTLVVTTTRISWPHFNRLGIRQTEAVEVQERFELTDSDETILYELTVTDPATLTEPYVWNGRWIWRPGEVVDRYDCSLEE
ncbi:MAG: DUF6152 family protein [Candidatus Rariloculaceae bacterium]